MDTFHAVIDSNIPLFKDLGFLADHLNIVENIRSIFRTLSNIFFQKKKNKIKQKFLKLLEISSETFFAKYLFGKDF